MPQQSGAATIAALARYKKYQRVFEKRLLAPLNAASKVKIRDITIGEITDAIGDTPQGLFAAKPAQAARSVKDIGTYVLNQFDEIAALAKQYHLDDNYDITTQALKPDCKDNITRIITTEFFFYNSALEEPWTDENFGILCHKLEKRAAKLPRGIHLVLASFPLANERNEMHNQVLHIECGPMPRLATTSKYYDALKDPSYDGITTSANNGNITLSYVLNNLAQNKDELNALLTKSLSNPKTTQEFNQCIFEIRTTIRHIYAHYPAHDKLIDLLKDITIQFAIICDDNDDIAKMILINSLIKELKLFIANVNAQIIPLIDAPKANLLNTASPAGAAVATAIEVCLDHENQVGIKSVQQALATNQVIPTHVSHIVTSNSIDIVPAHLLADTQLVTHADPDTDRVSLRKGTTKVPTEADLNKKLGKQATKVHIYPQEAVRPFAKTHLDAINKHNKKVVQAAVVDAALANQHYDVLTCVFFAATAQQQVKQLKEQGIITEEQAKNILATPEFMKLLNIKVLKPADFELMKQHARTLLNEPEAHIHIFKILQRISATDFAKMPDADKIALFKLPFETYEIAPQGGHDNRRLSCLHTKKARSN